MDPVFLVPIAVVAASGGVFAGYLLGRRLVAKTLEEARTQSRRMVAEGEKDAQIRLKEALLEAKEKTHKQRLEFEREAAREREELNRVKQQQLSKQSELDSHADLLSERERGITAKQRDQETRERAILAKEGELEKVLAEQNRQLERIAGMTSDEARQRLMENLEAQVRHEAAQRAREIREAAERDAEREARAVIVGAIQRTAADHAAETTVLVVNLPTDEMKGRIIGREGRNIRAFEQATGIDVIVDDTPEAVILSGFDPVRREIARMALERLVLDGRIHPARIEEVVEKATEEMETIVRETGEQVCFDVGVHGVHPELVRLLGKLQYRTSYGQNVLLHSKEVSMLCGIIAAELGLDAGLAKRAGLLHDVGKAIDRDTEGTHTQIGADAARRHGEPDSIVNAIESHHEDVEMTSLYASIVQAADSISGARPGARRETLEAYVKRLEKLEQVADSFKGVAKAYAIQAGREIRVIVENDKVDDMGAYELAAGISRKIQAEMEYPGQIKVTVIRETRATEYAK
jgi:ribonuclease Y